MSIKNKVKVFKTILTGFVLILMVGMTVYLFPVMKNLTSLEGQMAFKEKVESSGILGMLSLIGLQVAQIFLVIVPGEPVEILAGMCYGAVGGSIFIMLSACVISCVIFGLVRKFGRSFVCNFCDEEKVAKIEKSKLFQNPRKIERIMLILFLIPGTPKDLLVYVAGLLPIRPIRFIVISTLARFPSVISSTLAGEHLALGNWKMSLILYAVVLLLVGIIIFIMNKLDKDKTTEEVLKTMNEK